MRLRLRGTPWECREVAARLATVLKVVSTSGPYPDGASGLVRLSLEVRVPDDGGATAPIRPESPAGMPTANGPRLIRPESPPAATVLAGDPAETPVDPAGEAPAVVVLPESDGEILAVLTGLEEVLATIATWAAAEGVLLPPALPAAAAARAVGALAEITRAFEQALADLEVHDDLELLTQVLVSPEGEDLLALHLVELAAGDLAAIQATIAGLGTAFEHRPLTGGSPEATELVVEALYARSDDPAGLIRRARRLAALLALPPRAEVAVLRDAGVPVFSATTRSAVATVVLGTSQYPAYEAVTEAILATWHAGDPLARSLYGVSP